MSAFRVGDRVETRSRGHATVEHVNEKHDRYGVTLDETGDVVTVDGTLRVVGASPGVWVAGSGDITLTANDGGASNHLIVHTGAEIQADHGHVNLRAGDDLTLEQGSTVTTPAGQVSLWGDFDSMDADLGSLIRLYGTIDSHLQATVTGAADSDTIDVDPAVGDTISSVRLDGADADDMYMVQYGRLTGGQRREAAEAQLAVIEGYEELNRLAGQVGLSPFESPANDGVDDADDA